MKRILIVTQYFWPESFRINDLVSHLVETGNEVTVLTGKPNYPAGRYFPGYGFFGKSTEQYSGARVVRVPMLSRGKGGSLRLAMNYFSFAFFGSLLAPFRCRDNYDVIFVFEVSPVTVGLPAVVLKRLKKTPIVFWVQDLWPESLTAAGGLNSPWILKQVTRLVQFIYRHCDRILVQSRGFTGPVEAIGVPAGRIRYFPNWAEAVFRPVDTASEPAPETLPQGFRIMFAGNMGSAQSLDTIIAAARLVKDKSIHWVFLGDGRRYAWLEEKIRDYGLEGQVHLLGRKPVEEMPLYFAHADVLLVTLRRDPIFSLTIPSKVQSYLAAGRPILAALDGEGARIIEEAGAGVAVPAEDPRALADAAVKLHGLDEKARFEMGRSGLAYCKREFDRDKLMQDLDVLFDEVLEESA